MTGLGGLRSWCRRTDESFTGSQGVGARAEGCEAKLQYYIDDVLLYAHKIGGLLGTAAQDGHLDFHTALSTTSMMVEVLLYVHRNCRLIRDGSPGRPPRLSHSS